MAKILFLKNYKNVLSVIICYSDFHSGWFSYSCLTERGKKIEFTGFNFMVCYLKENFLMEERDK